jgi:hypothetical protein
VASAHEVWSGVKVRVDRSKVPVIMPPLCRPHPPLLIPKTHLEEGRREGGMMEMHSSTIKIAA